MKIKKIQPAGLGLPLVIRNVAEVDDAGSVQLECQMTARFLVELYEQELLQLTGNIRPAHNTGKRLMGKTRTKVNKWIEELNNNNAVLGNISIRLDPTKADYEIELDEETGELCLTIEDGELDCAVDSLSRIKAIIGAAENPLQSFDLDTRLAVRIWLLDDAQAAKVATIYNTRGDKVNDSTAKFAYSESKEQEIARKLVNGSPHLRQDNVEVLSNSVSASSNKLCAFNTISKAVETSWRGGPVSAADVDAQAQWLITAWDALVAVRPEYGLLSTPARQQQRKDGIASSAVVIYGLIGAMSQMYAEGIDPAKAFKKIAAPDVFAWDNPIWTEAGVVGPTGSAGGIGTSNSFPSRRAATRVLCELMGLTAATDEDAA